jgi:tetratricopeptide (TPR) repeat protein
LAQAIAGQLRAKVSAREKVAVREWPTKDLVAYDFYARATSLMDAALYSSHQKLLEAVELLNKAVARDPDFLLAYCKLAHAYDSIYVLGPDHTPVRLALAAAAVNTALRLNPNSSEAHLALAAHLYACLDYDRSRAELAVAGRALPNDHRIFEVAAYIDRRQGLWEASTRNFERAIELDPRNITILRYCASNYLFRREYRQAYAAYDRILVISPDDDVTRLLRARVDMWSRADTQPLHDAIEKISPKDPAGGEVVMPNRFFVALWERDPAAARRALALLGENVMIARNIGATQISPSLAEALIARMKGDASAAHTAFAAARVKQQEMVLLQPDFGPPLCVLGLIDAGLGQKEQALHEGRRALELTPVAKNSLDGADVLYFFAVICAWTGERDAAIEQLETLAKIPGGVSYGDLRLSPFWDQLRDDPRFARIVASLAPKEIANR